MIKTGNGGKESAGQLIILRTLNEHSDFRKKKVL